MSVTHEPDCIFKIKSARIDMLRSFPFWGSIALIMEPHPVKEDDPNIKTIATNGRKLYYNPKAVRAMTRDEMVWAITHVTIHIVYDHIGRRYNRDEKLYHYACDLVANCDLEELRIGKRPGKNVSGTEPAYDPDYNDKIVEEVYELLLKKFPNRDDLPPSFDYHMEIGEGMDASERADFELMLDSAILQANSIAGGKGQSNSVMRYISDLTEPKLDWRSFVSTSISEMKKSDYTWSRQSKKSRSMGLYLPAQDDASYAEVVVALDTSGSMSEEMLRDLVSEVYGAMSQFNDYKLHILCFDTSVHNPKTFTPDNAHECTMYEPMGGGGTAFECVFKWLKDREITPKQLVFLTDGYPNDSWGDPDYCDTVFIIHSNPRKDLKSPFGTTLYYE